MSENVPVANEDETEEQVWHPGGGIPFGQLFGSGGSQAANAAIGAGVPVGTQTAVAATTPWWQNPATWSRALRGVGMAGNILQDSPEGGMGIPNFNFNQVPGGGGLPGAPDLSSVMDQFNQLFGGSGGGGGGGGGNQVREGFLQDLFNNPNSFGQVDPSILENIGGIQGASSNEYQQFLNMIGGGANNVSNMILGGGNNLLSMLGGGAGGGVFGGGGFGGGGGGGFNTNAASIFNSLPTLELDRIMAEVPQLSPELQEQFDTILQSNLADIESQREDQNSQLLTSLFGRGVNRSTVALEGANRLNESLERTLLATRSEDAQRRLGTQMELGGRQLSADLARQQGLIDIFGNRLGSATSLATAGIGASAQTRSASIGAGASMANARLGALSDIYRTQVGGLSDIFGSSSGALASGFGNRQGFLSGALGDLSQLGLGQAGLENERFLNLANLAQGGIDSRRSANQAAGNARFGNIMDFLRYQEDVNRRLQQGQLTREGFQVDRSLAQAGQPPGISNWDRMIALGGVVGSFYGS